MPRRLAAAQAGADGHAVAERLGRCQQVGRGALVPEAIPGAGSAQPGLHLVQYQQQAAPVAQFAHRAQRAVGGNANAVFALNRLQHHRAQLRRFVGGLFQRGDVAERRLDKAGRERRRRAGVLAERVGRAPGAQCAPVERAARDRDNRVAVAVGARGKTRNLDGGLVGLGAGVAEKRRFKAADARQFAGEFFLRRNPVEIGGVRDAPRLFAQRRGHRRVRVAEAANGDAGDGVEITPALVIPQPRAFAVREGDRQARVVLYQATRGSVRSVQSVQSVH